MTKTNRISTPSGTYGLAVAPWSPDEIYAVAADWAQASGQVITYEPDGWEITPFQVADFRHQPRKALEWLIRDITSMDHYEPDDDDVNTILDNAVAINDDEINDDTDLREL